MKISNKVKSFFEKNKKKFSSVLGLSDTPFRTSLAFSIGIFLGLLPIFPLQSILAIIIAFILRMNRVVVFLGTLIFQFFTAPFIIGGEIWAGSLIFKLSAHGFSKPLCFAIGAIVFSICGAALSFPFSYIFFRHHRQKRKKPVYKGMEDDG